MILPGSYSNGFAPRDGQPLHPELWRGCDIALPILLGVTGQTLRDFGNDKARRVTQVSMGASTWAAAQGVYSQQFASGTDRYLHYGSALNYTSQDFSLYFNFMVDSFTTNQTGQGPALCYKGDYRKYGYYLTISQAGGASFTTNQSGADQTTSIASGQIQLNQMHRLAISRKGANVLMCLDGRIGAAVSGSHLNPTTSPDNFMLGRYAYTTYIINGALKIAEFRAYSRALLSNEMQTLTSRNGIAYELAPRRRSSVQVIASFNRRRRLLVGAGS